MPSDAVKQMPETTNLPDPGLAKTDPEAWARELTQRLEEDYQMILRVLRELAGL